MFHVEHRRMDYHLHTNHSMDGRQTMPELCETMLARGVQGLAGGMLVGVAFACVPDLFPDRLQRVRWQVMLSASFGVASALGPALGGWMTEHAGWRSVFYVNLPVALLALPVIWRYLPHIVHHDGEEERSIDWLGALLMTAAILAGHCSACAARTMASILLPRPEIKITMFFIVASCAYLSNH